MKVLKSDLDKSWKVPVRKNDDGNMVEICAGTDGANGATNPFIFEGGLRYVGHRRVNGGALRFFFEVDGIKLPFSASGMDKMQSALRDGRLVVKNGRIYGKWSFNKRGKHVSTAPLDESKELELQMG